MTAVSNRGDGIEQLQLLPESKLFKTLDDDGVGLDEVK